MEAACRGARAEGGTTIGILPGSSREEANAYVEYPVATGLGEARNAVVVGTADAVIAVRGGHGTLSEIGLALKMGRPVVGLDTWVLREPGQGAEALIRASGADEAVEKALALAGQGSAGERG
jgi:hypothetical protein